MMNTYLIAAMHALLSGVICWTCLCRLNLSSLVVLLRVRVAYSVLLACYVATALGPYYGEWPGWSTLGVDVGVIFILGSGMRRWKRAAPEDVKTQPGDLEPFRG